LQIAPSFEFAPATRGRCYDLKNRQNICRKMATFAQTLLQNFDHTIGFEKKRIFFTEN
jgi:hypothetical protein